MRTPVLTFTPQEVDLELYAGDGVALEVVVQTMDQVPIDLTGEVFAQVRSTRGDPEPLAEFYADLTSAADGTVILMLTGEQTAELILQPGVNLKGAWDVQWSPEGAEPVSLMQGKATCYADVTRP